MQRARKLLRLRPGQGLVAVFVLTIMLPGILLALFGLRTLMQERRLAEGQVRERLDGEAESAAQDLDREFRQWELALEQTRDPALVSPMIQRAMAEPGSAALVVVAAGETRVMPPAQMLYEVTSHSFFEAPRQPVSAPLAEAELHELRHKDYPRSIAAYIGLLTTATPQARPGILHRLARSYRKAGQFEQALRTYQEIASASGRIGALPADLVGKYEVCSLFAERHQSSQLKAAALEFYHALAGGRWRLEKSRYLFYSEAARSWLEGVSFDRSPEEKKLALTLAVEEILTATTTVRRRVIPGDSGIHVAFCRRAGARFAALIVAGTFLQSHSFPRIFSTTRAQNLDVSLLSSSGQILFATAPAAPGELTASRSLEESGLPWRLRVAPRDPGVLFADLARRQNFYLAASMLVLAVMIFGGYSTIRTMRRESEIVRLKADFVSAVSHEFRSPLTGIRQLGELLMRGRVKSDEKRQQYYEMITRESDRLTRLVENVLDFSRIEEGARQYRLQPLEPAPWLRGLVEDFQSEAAANGVSVAASIPPHLPVVLADREALTTSIHNLLDNAAKYSLDSKTVWLDAEAANAGLTIRVRDHGVGIAEEDQKHIFEKFYRGGGEAARQVKGAGLGLSLVKHIIAAHGGTVQFESRKGEGSTFCIQIPAGE